MQSTRNKYHLYSQQIKRNGAANLRGKTGDLFSMQVNFMRHIGASAKRNVDLLRCLCLEKFMIDASMLVHQLPIKLIECLAYRVSHIRASFGKWVFYK